MGANATAASKDIWLNRVKCRYTDMQNNQVPTLDMSDIQATILWPRPSSYKGRIYCASHRRGCTRTRDVASCYSIRGYDKFGSHFTQHLRSFVEAVYKRSDLKIALSKKFDDTSPYGTNIAGSPSNKDRCVV